MLNRLLQYFKLLFAKKPEEAPIEVQELPQPKQEPVKTHRAEDHSAEAQLAIFLDKFLYERFPNREAFSSIRRIYDKAEQLNGVDVEFVGKNGRVYCIDEKASLHYLNKDIPTFAFELLSFQKGYDTVGWLCNDKLKTDLYMLVWPFASQDSYKSITWEQFTKADCLLIQKQKIIRMLEDKGLSVDRMLSDARRIRSNKQSGKIPINGIRGIYYYASDPNKYQEAPINVIISKPILKDLSQRRYIVTPEQVTTE